MYTQTVRIVFFAAALFNGFLYLDTLKHGAFSPWPHPIPISFFPIGILLLLAAGLSKRSKTAKFLVVGALVWFSLTLSIIYVLMPMYVPVKWFREMLDPALLADRAARAQKLLSFLLALLGPVFTLVAGAVSRGMDEF
jgi:peptidoglycan/LPS O-acetylase OafA/YrhL